MAGKIRYIILFLLIIAASFAFSQNTQKKKETLDYIEKFKDIAMEEMQKDKIPASITLAQGILESGNGQSKLAKQGNNHFGIKCHSDWKGKRMHQDDDAPNECFRVYDNAEDSYRDHSKFLKNGTRYQSLFELSITDYKGWAKGLKKAGYATLPTYATVLINLIETYDLQQYDQMVVSGKYKKKSPKVDEQLVKPAKAQKPVKTKKSKGNAKSYETPVLENRPAVEMTANHHFIKENFGVEFIVTKANDNLSSLAKELKIYEYQLIKYNNLGSKRTFSEGEILYIQPKRRRAPSGYNIHVVKYGETLEDISNLYAVKLERLYKMNDLDKSYPISVGQEIKLR